ncbi:helix-turn-helix domain-containing protein [Streptomyces sp. JJ66]|uniref:helix-turn-helix domain-containing protein n=1 Tax=Streptomyces sp. JJ66 TaxID=2803843 RepID=UPI001C563B06|nr:helix-turn-helix transcriptional regulator [Streptomyces sp. JJ66]MBW1604478.1 helix-turn-helix domain-containing protein [Streptomyces sp. JJ66]
MAAREPQTEHFAAYLRELKQRSGHSYGTLARRLHLSTSTLHRYCNGAAVPLDYAPAERLARLCGATPGELTELHRRWLLADASRSAPAASSDPAAPSGPAASSDPAPAADVPSCDGADTPPAEDAAPDAEPSGSVGIAADRAPGDAEAPAPDAAPETRAAGRRARLLAGAAATAVLLLTGTLAAVTRDADDSASLTPPAAPADPSRSAGAPAPDAGAGAFGSVIPPDEAGGATSGGTPSPGAEGRRPSPGTTPGTQRTPGQDAATTPLAVTTRSHVWQDGCDHRYLIDPAGRAPADVPPPPLEPDAPAWAAGVGAVHGGQTLLEVAVQGVDDTAVVLQALHVRVVERDVPLPWNAYAMSDGCGGALTPARYTVDLDASRPQAVASDGYDGTGEGRELPAQRFPFRVSASDPQVLRITTSATECACSWYLELEWSAQGRSGTLRIDDQGRPFRTSGLAGRPLYRHVEGEGWQPGGTD